jgi:hypothetical protein
MRLRQAHAMFEAATNLAACGLGFEAFPFDREDSGEADDYMTVWTDLTDPGFRVDARHYCLELRPSADGRDVAARLTYGMGPVDDRYCELLNEAFPVWNAETSDEFRAGAGVDIAARVLAAVREHEAPFEAAFRLTMGGAE